MNSYNVILGEFNEKIKFAFHWNPEFISIKDDRIDEERKRIYRQLSRYLKQTTGKKLEKIPFLNIDEMGIYTDQQSRSLLQLVDGVNIIEYPDFTHFSNKNFLKIHPQENNAIHGESTSAGFVFSLMAYPFKNDNYANYNIAVYAKKPSLAKIYPQYFDPDPNPDASDRKKLKEERDNYNRLIQKWLNVKTKDDINDIIIEVTKRLDSANETNFELWIQNWSPYVKNILFESETSRLKPLRNEKGNGFIINDHYGKPIEFLLVDQTDTEFNWRDLLLKYRKENPATKYDSNPFSHTLHTRPYDYYILNSTYISFVAYHKEDRKMIGYAVFSLRNTPYLKTHKNKLRGNELKLFDEAMKERENRRDLGYDVFHFEGFHVHRDYRDSKKPLSNGVSVAKMFVFTGFEFIKHTYLPLGVKMIASSSLASATKQILVGTFGFSHYNRQNDTKWLRAIFEDFFSLLQKNATKSTKQNKEVKTPEKLLTLGHLSRESVKLSETYRTTFSEKETTILTSVITTLNEMVSKYGEARNPILEKDINENKFRSEFDRVLKKFRKLQDAIADDWDNENEAKQSNEVKYMVQLRAYLNTGGDDDDTLLFIGGERLPQKFLDAVENFPLKPTIIEIPEQEVLIIQDDVDNDLGNPVEEEMILYDMVLKLLLVYDTTNLIPITIDDADDNNKEDPVEINEIIIDKDDGKKIDKLRKQRLEVSESIKKLRLQEREISNKIVSLEEKRSNILVEINQSVNFLTQLDKKIQEKESSFVKMIPEREQNSIESNDKEEEEEEGDTVGEKMIIENKKTREDVFENKEEITGKNYKRIKQDYIAAVGAISVIMWDNYKEKFKLYDSGAGREGDKMYNVLKELGYPNEGFPQTFLQWKKAGSLPRISPVSLEIIVPLLKERYPLLLDYTDAELYPSK